MTDKENNITNNMNEQIKNKLAFLDKQEEVLKEKLEKGKQKEEELRNQLIDLKKKIEQISGEVLSGEEQKKIVKKMDKVLSDTEKKEIQQEFGEKSFTEIEEKIKTEPSKRQRMKKKIRIPLVGISIALATTFALYEYVQYQKKNKQKLNQEQAINPIDTTDSTAIILPTIKADIDTLQKHIHKNQMDSSISYETLANTINTIKNTEIRKEVVEYLYQGKIMEAQEMFGMKRDSKYPSNKATDKIDKNTIERFANPYFGLYGKEILDHKDIPQKVKDIYQKFLLGEIKNNKMNYTIISKTDFHIYVFTKDHKLLYRTKQPNLFGEDINKSGKRLPYQYIKTDQGYIYHNQPTNTNTPEGWFKVQKTKKIAKNYKCDGENIAIVLIPVVDSATQNIDNDRYEKIKIKEKIINTVGVYDMEIHPVYLPPEDEDKYKKAIETPEIKDNTVSHGCINTNEIGFFIDNLPIGSIIYITSQ